MSTQYKFKAKHRLKIAFASDETKTMLTAYGAWGEKSLYGRKYLGVMRKTFLVEGKGASPASGRRFPCPAMPWRCWPPRANCNALHSQPNRIELSGFLNISD